MAAPTKKYLSYYNWDCNAFDIDEKLFDLSYEHGPFGEVIYRRMLDLIYSNGFYIESTIDKLARTLSHKIGPQWLKVQKCKEILTYCVDIGLFDSDLVQRNIWTSLGIQNRYFGIMKQLKRSIDFNKEKYLLVDIVLNAPKSRITYEETFFNSEETGINSEETGVNSGKGKQSKENQIKSNKNIVDESEEIHFLENATIDTIQLRLEKTLNESEIAIVRQSLKSIDYALFKTIILETCDKTFESILIRVNGCISQGITKLEQYTE